MTTRITGTGRSLPAYIMKNQELTELVDTSDEWIKSRTGIEKRHIAKAETTSVLAAEAAKNALENAGIKAEDIDLIITATISPESSMPSASCRVQSLIGAGAAVCFDLNAACSGFIFALHTAHLYIASGLYRHALVIGAETLSKMVDWNDRGTCVLFGDGAGAAVLAADETGIIGFSQNSDGTRGTVLTSDSYIRMDGQEVFKFAVKTVPLSVSQLLAKNSLTAADVDLFVLHQANQRIIQSVAKHLQADPAKFPVNLDQYGNTSAASIPILLDELNRSSRLKRNDLLVLSGFGGGLTWGSTLLRW